MDTADRISQQPQLAASVFIAPGAHVMGTVRIGDKSSVWYNAVLRGDTEQITIGCRSNIQDGAIVHADPGDAAIIGDDCVIGHGAIVHGAVIEDAVLIGIQATVLNGARIGTGSIVGAHALVPAGMQVPPYSMVLGVPAKVVRSLGEDQADKIRAQAAGYCEKAAAFKNWIAQGSKTVRAAE